MVTLEKQRSLTLPADTAARPPPRALAPPSDRHSHSARSSSVQLTREYCDKAEEFTAARVHDTLRRFAAHHAVRQGVVDRKKWRLAKGGGRHNPIACYRRADGSSSARGAAGKDPKTQAELLAVGVVVGSVEDLLHGVVNLSPEAMQIESAMTQRDLLDGRVLGVVRAPSVRAPFRSLSLKWALRNHEELSRHRDYVFLEATGLVDAAALVALDFGPQGNGAGDDDVVVGYHLVHSLLVPGAPQLSADMQIVRGAVSYCFLFRQRGDHDVELFFRGYVHPQGGVRDAKAFQLAVETALATPHRVECGLMKKLAFSLRTRAPPGSGMSDPGARSTASTKRTGSGGVDSPSSSNRSSNRHHYHRSRSGAGGSNLCAVCRRSLRSLFFGKKPPACELCDALACARCRVAKRVFVFQDGLFHPAKMEFCTECVVSTTKLSAAWVAAQELALVSLDDDDDDRYDDEDEDDDSVDSVDMVDVVAVDERRGGRVEIDEEIQQRLTMSSDGVSGVGSLLGGGVGSLGSAKQLVWLPSDRVRPTIVAGSLSPPDADEYGDTYDVDAMAMSRLTGKEGASGPPNGLFVPNESEEDLDAIPMIDMPSEGEDDDAEYEVGDFAGGDPARFHRKDQPQTDLSYLY